MNFRQQQGFTLLEITITLALSGALALAAYSLYNYTNKNTKDSMFEITESVARLNAASIIQKDLSNAELSFNFLNIPDDNSSSFFIHAKNQYCRHKQCARTLTLKPSSGKSKGKSIYLVVKKTNLNEVQTLSIHPRSVFQSSTYAGINWQFNSPTHSISRDKFPLTSWEENRIMLLSSESEFFDCNISSMSSNAKTCQIECNQPGQCDYAIKRSFRFLGIVQPKPSIDLSPLTIKENTSLLSRAFNVCRPNKDNSCAAKIPVTIKDPKSFFEYLPYTPGLDERSNLHLVDIIKYHLIEEGSTNGEKEISLARSIGTIQGNQIIFGHSVKIMSGLDSVVFSRSNISNPVIEYKFKSSRRKNK